MTNNAETEVDWLWRLRAGELAVWFASGLALHLLQTPLYWSTWFLGALAMLAHFIWGIVLTGYSLTVACADARRDLAHLGFLSMAALAFFVFAPLWHWGDRLLFAVAHESQFDAAVKSVKAGGPLAGDMVGLTYAASEDRQFIAFFWLEGIPDGGTAIIYDPENRLTQTEVLHGELEKQILDLVLESPISCWDFNGPYSKCHYD